MAIYKKRTHAMPSSAALHLRSASQEQFRRPRRSASYRRQQTIGKYAGKSLDGSVSATAKASSGVASGPSGLLGLEIDLENLENLENVNPNSTRSSSQRDRQLSTRSANSFSQRDGPLSTKSTKSSSQNPWQNKHNGVKMSSSHRPTSLGGASTLTSMTAAAANQAAAPTNPGGYHLHASAVATGVAQDPPLSFEEFKKMRRQESDLTTKVSGSGGRKSYAEATRAGSQNGSIQEQPATMTFDEFREMKRLLSPEGAADDNWKQATQKKRQSRKEQSKQQSKQKVKRQYGAAPAASKPAIVAAAKPATSADSDNVKPASNSAKPASKNDKPNSKNAKPAAAKPKTSVTLSTRGYMAARKGYRAGQLSDGSSKEKEAKKQAKKKKKSFFSADEQPASEGKKSGAKPDKSYGGGTTQEKDKADEDEAAKGGSRKGGDAKKGAKAGGGGASGGAKKQQQSLRGLSPVPEDRPRSNAANGDAKNTNRAGDAAFDAFRDGGAAKAIKDLDAKVREKEAALRKKAKLRSDDDARVGARNGASDASRHEEAVAKAREALLAGEEILRRERYVVTHDIPVAMSALTEDDAVPSDDSVHTAISPAGPNHPATPLPSAPPPPLAPPLTPIQDQSPVKQSAAYALASGSTLAARDVNAVNAFDELDGEQRRTSSIIDEAEHLLSLTASRSIVETEDSLEAGNASAASVMESLPEDMPSTLVIPDDWEERAGFIASNANRINDENADRMGKAIASGAVSVWRSTLDTAEIRAELPIPKVTTGHEKRRDFASAHAAVASDAAVASNDSGEEEEEEEEEEEGDPRNASMWVVCDDDEDLDEEGTVDYPYEEAVEEEDASVDGGDRIASDASPKTNAVATSPGRDSMSSLVRDAIDFGANRSVDIASDSDDEKPEREEVKADGNIPRPSIIKEEDRELWPSMNFGGFMFDKDSGEILVVELEHSVAGDDKLDVKNSEGEEAGADLDGEAAAVKAAEAKPGEKRELKGRILLVRIKRKISKVPKKMSMVPRAMKRMFFLPFRSKFKGGGNKSGDDNDATHEVENCIILTSPKSIRSIREMIPSSPSNASVISFASSIVSVGNDGSVTVIGAVPARSGLPRPSPEGGLLYGAINYNDDHEAEERSIAESTVELPPPPAGSYSFPSMMGPSSSSDEEDAVSFLAEAMKRLNNDDDEEESVILLLAPKEDGTEEICEVFTTDDVDDGATHSSYTSGRPSDNNDLAGLFNKECGSPIQIMDAVEVEGGLLLTPTDDTECNEDRANVFRRSSGEGGRHDRHLLLGSVLDSDDEGDEDETMLYHDGCTAIRQAPTFGDETIDTRASATPLTVLEEAPASSPKSLVSSLQFDATSTPDASVESPVGSPSDSPSDASSSFHTAEDADESIDGGSTKKTSPVVPKSSSSPKAKSLPKSASPKTFAKTRRRHDGGGGLVKDRVTDIHQRLESLSAASSVSSSKASSSRERRYRQKPRTSIESCASSASSLVSAGRYIRSVPIGIAKTYSRDSHDGGGDGHSVHSVHSTSSTFSQSTGGYIRSVPIGIAKTYSRDAIENSRSFEGGGPAFEEDAPYAQKYTDTLDRY